MLGAVLLILLVWLGAAALSTHRAVGSARSGLEKMDGLRDTTDGGIDSLIESLVGPTDEIQEEDAAIRLSSAASDFADASSALDSWIMAPVKVIPVLGRQVRSASALARSAEIVASEAAVAVEELDAVLADSTADPGARLAAVGRSENALRLFREGIDEIDLGPNEALAGPLAAARNRFSDEYEEVLATVDEMVTVLAGVDSLLTGPTRYLVLGANNSEMRAGSGMLLQVAPMDVADGSFVTGDFLATGDLQLPPGEAEADADVEDLWGALSPAREWRNANLSPRFDTTGALTASMWEARGGGPVDGVLATDVPAIAALLELTGPVELPDGEVIESSTVEEDLLLGQYESLDDRDERRERLGEIAGAVFEALNNRDVSASELLRVLRDLGAGRHLMMWSSDPVQQAAWEELGTSGTLAPDSMMLSVMNRGGNKLDQFLDVSSQMSIESTPGGSRVTVEVALSNDSPMGLPTYVAGPVLGTGLEEGEYKGIVALTIPGGAGNVTTEGGVPVALGDDGPTRVAANEVRAKRGETATVAFAFDLPAEWESMTVLPSARVPTTAWSGPIGDWEDGLAEELPLRGDS